jgi:acyl-CoA synthetase (AMP-forming)/AMP-acid ligase II
MTRREQDGTRVTYPQLIARNAVKFRDRELVVDSTERFTFGQFEAAMTRSARAAIAAGVRPGDRVVLWAPNSARWLVAAMGSSAAGAVIVPMNTRFKGVEAVAALNRVRPRLLFTTRDFLGTDYPAILRAAADGPLTVQIVVLDAAADDGDLDWDQFLAAGEAVPPEEAIATRDSIPADSPSDIILTSGTTGEPKGVVTAHAQNVLAWTRYVRHLKLADGERTNATLPFFHNFGLKAGFLISVLLGGACICDATFDPGRLARTIEQERVSYLPGTPTMFAALLDIRAREGSGLQSLRRCLVAGAMVPVELVARIKQELGIEVFTGYGLSEVAGGVSLTPPGATPERVAEWAGSIVEGIEIRVVDEDGADLPNGEPGEILVRSDCTMVGYLHDTAATKATVDGAGWLHTGDIGVVDDEEYVKIVDRKKEMFIVGGFNAYPAEIEGLLLGQGSIARVAVVAMPDERLGEVGVAFVVPSPGAALDAEDVRTWARENMSNYKVPRKVFVVDTLPLNASLKVVKGELRERLLAQLQR